MEGFEFCYRCSKFEEIVAVYFIEFEKVIVSAGRRALTYYALNQGSICFCFKENWMRRRYIKGELQKHT